MKALPTPNTGTHLDSSLTFPMILRIFLLLLLLFVVTMQDPRGDSTLNASSPNKAPSTNHKSEASALEGRGRGRGRPISDNVKIPWQVLELTSGSTTGGGGCGCPVAVAATAEDGSGGSSGGAISHRRKPSKGIDTPPLGPTWNSVTNHLHSLHPNRGPLSLQQQRVSPPKSPQQQPQNQPSVPHGI